MENSKLVHTLSQLNLPIAYHKFEEGDAPDLPYLVYFQRGDNNFGADNKVFFADNDYAVELYTRAKDFELEHKLENILTDDDIFYLKLGDARIKDEDMIVVVYYL